MFPGFNQRTMCGAKAFFYFQQHRTITFLPAIPDDQNFIQYLLQRPTVTADFEQRLLAFLNQHVRHQTALALNKAHGLILNLARIA